jgi:hypothetical protein
MEVDTDTAMEVWIGMAERVDLISDVRPTPDLSQAFQVGKWSATTESIRGWRSLLLSLKIERGTSKYLQGKWASCQGNKCCISSK